MRRVSLSLPTGVLAYLQDVTGEVDLATAIVVYLAGRRKRGGLSEQYMGDEYRLIRWRPKTRGEASMLAGVNGKALTESIVCEAKRHGVTIRLPSRGIW